MAVYTVYRVTCVVTGNFYVGVHRTENPSDEYLGSGLRIRKSVRKHGASNHLKEILHTFTSAEEAYSKEAEEVAKVRNTPRCMNIMPGGQGPPNLPDIGRAAYLLKISGDKRRKFLQRVRMRERAMKARDGLTSAQRAWHHKMRFATKLRWISDGVTTKHVPEYDLAVWLAKGWINGKTGKKTKIKLLRKTKVRVEVAHGTITRYTKYGCRCGLCVACRRDFDRARYLVRKERGDFEKYKRVSSSA